MALWQIPFNVYPSEDLDISKFVLSEDYFDEDEDAWKKLSVSIDYFDEIKNILPVGKSWSQRLVILGDIESNVFEIGIEEDNTVSSASFRIDFRTDFERIVKKIIDFCIQNNLTVINMEMNEVSLNYETFELAIKQNTQTELYNRLAQN